MSTDCNNTAAKLKTYGTGIPVNLHQPIVDYVQFGMPLGGYLTAIVSNDLTGAIGQCSTGDMTEIKFIVDFFYNNIPGSCWRSREAMTKWQASGGTSQWGKTK